MISPLLTIISPDYFLLKLLFWIFFFFSPLSSPFIQTIQVRVESRFAISTVHTCSLHDYCKEGIQFHNSQWATHLQERYFCCAFWNMLPLTKSITHILFPAIPSIYLLLSTYFSILLPNFLENAVREVFIIIGVVARFLGGERELVSWLM